MNLVPVAFAFVGAALAAYEDQRTGRIGLGLNGFLIGAGIWTNGFFGLFCALVAAAVGVIQIAHIKPAPYKFGDVLLFAGLAALLPPLVVVSTFGLSVALAWVWTKFSKHREKKIRFAPFIFAALTVVLSVNLLM